MSSWNIFLNSEKEKIYFKRLNIFLEQEYKTKIIFPKKEDLFNSFSYTEFENVKVIIVGQDPYHGLNQAHGLAFSVKKGIPIPKSLQNIYKELKEDVGFVIPEHGCLEKWAKEGVLLLNTTLSVEQSKPLSHTNKGWEILTTNVIKKLNEDNQPKVFMFWGNHAQKLKVYLTNPKHLILCASHPSPLSAHRGFFGCKHFSKANKFLFKHNRQPINWQI